MEKYFKGVNLKCEYPNTLPRLKYIAEIFKEFYQNEKISDDKIEERVVECMAIYGEGKVYDIYIRIHQGDRSKEVVRYMQFLYVFKKEVKEAFRQLEPRHLIGLYLEYYFSLVLKGTFHKDS